MGIAADRPKPASASSAGMLILGMHRSGTTALARVLAACGFDPGTRVIEGSAGNEAGHWEDAFAVEMHERLLSEFGAGWSEPAPMPARWLTSPAAERARGSIRAYLQNDRAAHRAWVLKDPRASLFAPLWIEQAEQAGIPLGAVLMLRHPMEVAASLAARDGLSLERGLWLWLEYTAAAATHACAVPNVVLSYERLLLDWHWSIALLRPLPGGELLSLAAHPGVVEPLLDPGLRHHAGTQPTLPGPIARIWSILSAGVGKPLDAQVIDEVFEAFLAMQDLVQPLAADWRWRHRQLWERAARAEDLVSRNAVHGRSAVEQLQDLVSAQGRDIIVAFSSNIQGMQGTAQEAIRAHAQIAGEYSELRRAAEGQQSEWQGERAQLRDALSMAGHELASLRERLAQEEKRFAEANSAQAAERDRLRLIHEELMRVHNAGTVRVDALEAELARLRDEHFQLRIQSRELAESAQTLALVLRSRSWRWSRPFRVVMRLLGGRWGNEDRRKLRTLFAWRTPPGIFEVRGAALPLEHAERQLATNEAARALDRQVRLARAGGNADVFVWSVIDWHFRTQRPQHLARAMSEQGHRVFYMSNNFEDSASPGFRVEPLDESGRLFQIHLHLQGRPAIYHGMPDDMQLVQLRASFARLLAWTATRASLSIVQHAFWNALAMSCPDARVVYDCMDHHAGFEDNAPGIVRGEADLIASADLVVVTSDDLQKRIGQQARNIAIVRNACDYAFFSSTPAQFYRQAEGRKVIGYFGAIAEWFDPELVRTVARAHPEAEILLIGSDTSGTGALLADEANVRMVGELPYAELPYWLHGFDVCMLPFRVVPLTLATNPVKVYEYLAAGKPVVAVDLPEMGQFGNLVRTSHGAEGFAAEISAALADGSGSASRQAFAAGQTWRHRADAFDRAVAEAREPKVSVIVLTYNNWILTEACLRSLDASGNYPDLEIVVVDNASTDGSAERLVAWRGRPAPRGQQRRLILNSENLGFAAGNNIGLQAATGELLILLNNDTYVTPGWIRTLCAHFRTAPRLGLLGPVTNNIGNEAKIEIAYKDMADMVEQASRYTLAHPGMRHPMRTAAFFCVAMPRQVYEAVGGLDERYGVGFFEDDDYCRRVEQAGWSIACAEDVYVHHHLSASFNALGDDVRQRLFERNKALYEERWGTWQPHAYRAAGTAEA